MGNETVNKNAVVKLGEGQLAKQDYFVGQIKNLFAKQNVPLTDYQIKCGNNAVAKMIQMAQTKNKDITDYPQAQTLFALQNIISNEWDVLQGEGVIIFQWNKKTVDVTDNNGKPKLDEIGKNITTTVNEQYFDLRPTAKGHLKTIRMYGAGLDKKMPIILSYVVYDGDEFTDISYEGVEVTPPKYRPMRLSNKVMRIVYALKMIDGTIQYIVGQREHVKPALIAQAKNNGAPDKDLQEMNSKSVDEILAAYEGKTFTKDKYNVKTKKYDIHEQLPYFNDTWVAGYNREQMLETKLRGVIANRMIDKEFNNEFQKEAFDHVIVEKPRYSNREEIDHEEQSQEMIEAENGAKDFKVDKRASKELEIIEEEDEEPQDDELNEEEQQDEEIIEEEPIIQTKTPEDTKSQDTKKSNKPNDNDLFGGFGL